jgi:spore coat protein U-like protein
MNRKNVALLTAGIVLALAGSAQAATRTAAFQVSASVVDNCIIGATALNLGTFDGTNDLTSSSNITVRCSNGSDFTVDLSTGVSGSYTTRHLVNATSTSGLPLVYNLYLEDTYNTVWGNGSNGTGRVSDFGEGMALANAITHTVYGRLLASSNTGAIDAGSYTDTITATVTY